MSLFKSVLGAVAPIVGTMFGGPVGGAIGGMVSQALAPRPAAPPPAMPGGAAVIQTMGSLPAIGGAVVGAGGAVVRAGIAGGRMILASARYYCARYPGWCLSIGGLGVVEGLVREGKLPVHRRRRGKGISSRDFRGFRRVHNVLSGFCAPRMKIRRRALRS